MLDPEYLSTLRDVNGSDYLGAARSAGYGGDTYEAMLQGARRTSKDIGAFVELHIEQVWAGLQWLEMCIAECPFCICFRVLDRAHFWRKRDWKLAL